MPVVSPIEIHGKSFTTQPKRGGISSKYKLSQSKKKAPRRAFQCNSDTALHANQLAVIYSYTITALQRGRLCLRENADIAVVKANGNFIVFGATHIFFYLVTGIRTTKSTDNGTDSLASTAPNLIAQQAANNAAANRAKP